MVETATDNVTRTVANVRMHFKSQRRQHGHDRPGRASCSSARACSGLDPEGLDRDALELDLIDHGLISLDDGEGEKGEKQLLVRVAFNDFGTMQTALEARKITPLSTASEYVPATTTRAARRQDRRSAEDGRRLRRRRRRAERLHEPRLAQYGSLLVPGAAAGCVAIVLRGQLVFRGQQRTLVG